MKLDWYTSSKHSTLISIIIYEVTSINNWAVITEKTVRGSEAGGDRELNLQMKSNDHFTRQVENDL